MKLSKNIIVSFCVIYFTNMSIYAQYHRLDVLCTINDPSFPESGLNSDQIAMRVGHIGDGFDDWAIGLPAGTDYETGHTAGTEHIYYGGKIPGSESPPDLIIGSQQGQYEIIWNASGFSNGLYFYQILTYSFVKIRHMLLR